MIVERWENAKRANHEPLRILDLCTGTGCIALLLHNILSSRFQQLEIHGIDVSSKAIKLANLNKQLNIGKSNLEPRADSQIGFAEANIFESSSVPQGEWDVLISNPPYISPNGFSKTTSRSVRRFEPKLALVPTSRNINLQPHVSDPVADSVVGDAFYSQLLQIAQTHESGLVVLEVGDTNQAQRVVSKAILSHHWDTCEIWRDWPEQNSRGKEILHVSGEDVHIRGEGNGRAVVLTRNPSSPESRVSS